MASKVRSFANFVETNLRPWVARGSPVRPPAWTHASFMNAQSNCCLCVTPFNLQTTAQQRRSFHDSTIRQRAIDDSNVYFFNAIIFLQFSRKRFHYTSWLFISTSYGANISKNVAPSSICIPKSDVPMEVVDLRSYEIETAFQRLPHIFGVKLSNKINRNAVRPNRNKQIQDGGLQTGSTHTLPSGTQF